MTSATVNRVNAALKAADLPIYMVKEPTYIWFGAEDNAPAGIEDYIGSIYSCHLRDMTVEQYVEYVKAGYETGMREIAA